MITLQELTIRSAEFSGLSLGELGELGEQKIGCT